MKVELKKLKTKINDLATKIDTEPASMRNKHHRAKVAIQMKELNKLRNQFDKIAGII